MGTKEEGQLSLLLDDLTALEEYIHDLFSFSPLPICFVSPVGVVLEVNPAMEKVSGFKMEEIVGESLERVFKKEEIGPLVKETLGEGFVDGKELRFFPKTGQEITTQVFTRTRKDEKGEVVGYFLSLLDLSGIKKTEAELKRVQAALLNILEDTEEARRKAEEEKNKTQAIITNFTDALFFFDRDHRLAIINPQAENFFKIDKEEVTGESIEKLHRLPNLHSLIEFLGEEIKEISRKEFMLAEDSIFEVSVISMRRDEADLGDLVVLHDVSREKMVERLKTEFVSLSAHQLRTPLSAIKWSLMMLLDGDLGPINKNQKDILQKTYQSNERMIALINDLLNLARIEEGKYALSLAPVDIVNLCQSVIDPSEESFKNKGVNFSFKKPDQKAIQVSADAEKLKLVIQNLLDNALKYTAKGGRVSLSLKVANQGVRLEVKDSGIGIAEKEQKRVFSKFFRTTEAVLIEPAGSGLGLYMAKNIIEGHGGEIGFASKVGQGTTFYFVLPAQS
ncbi:MAG: PAS domain S-box protein [Candidatus Nealsonbacteria bacterium]|nr:PAS domain S-box protein [Candidatus Nealsonbacteria bacterium]